MPTTKKSKKTVAIKDLSYTASIKIFGKLYRATGQTAKEAIANLKPSGTRKGMSILTISKDGLSKDRMLPANQTYRLFSASPLMREIALKQISLMFGGL